MPNLERCPDCAAPYVLHQDRSIRCLQCDDAHPRIRLAPLAATRPRTESWSYRQPSGSLKGKVTRA